MSNDTATKLIQPGTLNDQLTDVLRNGAHALLAQAIEAEVSDFLCRYADLKTGQGHRRIVRHGYLPEREVMTGTSGMGLAMATDPAQRGSTPGPLPQAAGRCVTRQPRSPRHGFLLRGAFSIRVAE